MKPITLEWVKKAEGDFAVMERESRVRKNPSYDGACFHAQQCVEKYLKARLIEAGIDFPKTHDLGNILELALEVEPLWQAYKDHVAYLTTFAVGFRYPGEDATKEDILEAKKLCRALRKVIRQSLGLGINKP